MRIILPLALLIGSCAEAASPKPACPPTLEEASSIEAPAGWEVIPPRYGPSLDGVTIYDGHPRELASQVPDELPARGGFYIQRWPVGANTWLECRYQGSNSTIARQLPKGISECKAYYKKLASGFGPFERIECK